MFAGGVPSLPSKSLNTAGPRPTPGGGSTAPKPSSPAPFNLFGGGAPTRKSL